MSPAADTAAPAVSEEFWENSAILHNYSITTPGESFFLTAPYGLLADVPKQVGTTAPGFAFCCFMEGVGLPPPTHIELLGWHIIVVERCFWRSAPVFLTVFIKPICTLPFDNVYLQSYMNMQSRKLMSSN